MRSSAGGQATAAKRVTPVTAPRPAPSYTRSGPCGAHLDIGGRARDSAAVRLQVLRRAHRSLERQGAFGGA